jgi:hypothetical protein
MKTYMRFSTRKGFDHPSCSHLLVYLLSGLSVGPGFLLGDWVRNPQPGNSSAVHEIQRSNSGECTTVVTLQVLLIS